MQNESPIIKSPEQINGIKKSCKVAASCLQYAETIVKEGVSLIEIDNKIYEFMKDNKAESACLGYKGYPAATCLSVNQVVCHGIPNDYVLKNGDIINVDVTTIVDGYFGDCSTMFSIGEITKEEKTLLEVTKKCMEIGIEKCIAGNSIGDIGFEINSYARKFGFQAVRELTGHGVGVRFHEPPNIPFYGKKNTGTKLVPNMTVTIEPMINMGDWKVLLYAIDGWTIFTKDGKKSAQYEHTVLITEKEPEVLTKI